MANPNRRGQAGSPVSTGSQGDTATPFANTHFILPYGLRLQQTVTGTGLLGSTATGTSLAGGASTVTIPSGINFVYAIVAGGGGGGSNNGGGGGGAGGIAWGWTLATSYCVVGAGASYGTTRG